MTFFIFLLDYIFMNFMLKFIGILLFHDNLRTLLAELRCLARCYLVLSLYLLTVDTTRNGLKVL